MSTAAPITTESIIREDGATAALSKFAIEVREGEEETRRYLAATDSAETWTFRGLRDAVYGAADGEIRMTAVANALMALDQVGVIDIDYARWTVVVPS
jgi:hypothetical protein